MRENPGTLSGTAGEALPFALTSTILAASIQARGAKRINREDQEHRFDGIDKKESGGLRELNRNDYS